MREWGEPLALVRAIRRGTGWGRYKRVQVLVSQTACSHFPGLLNRVSTILQVAELVNS